LGEPKDEELDIGLAVAEGKQVEVYVLGGEHVWDINAIRTGEETVVKSVSRASDEPTGTEEIASEPNIEGRMRIRPSDRRQLRGPRCE
jgi:hypothetical protein